MLSTARTRTSKIMKTWTCKYQLSRRSLTRSLPLRRSTSKRFRNVSRRQRPSVVKSIDRLLSARWCAYRLTTRLCNCTSNCWKIPIRKTRTISDKKYARWPSSSCSSGKNREVVKRLSSCVLVDSLCWCATTTLVTLIGSRCHMLWWLGSSKCSKAQPQRQSARSLLWKSMTWLCNFWPVLTKSNFMSMWCRFRVCSLSTLLSALSWTWSCWRPASKLLIFSTGSTANLEMNLTRSSQRSSTTMQSTTTST